MDRRRYSNFECKAAWRKNVKQNNILLTKLINKRSFFQSVCVLGYCVFPINISSFIAIFLPSHNLFFFLIKMSFCGVGMVFSTKASIPFMAVLVSEEKKLLAVYPVLLFYLFLSWFALIA